MMHATAPAVVPRWEWRTFAVLDVDPLLAPTRSAEPVESDESYILSEYAEASVKIRGGVLDVKVLTRVDGAGLQQWVPTMKATFPLDRQAWEVTFAALDAPPLIPPHPAVPPDEFVTELIGSREDLCVVEVHKSRRHSFLDGCMTELTELTVGGRTVQTLVVESPDPELVSRTVRRLGLQDRPNTSLSRGLRSLLGWGPPRYAVLDIGTNSVKLTQGDRRGTEGSLARGDRAVVTRLGEGLAETGELTANAMRRTLDVVAELVEDVRRPGPVDIVAVGTAALRQAPNRGAFVEAVFSRCGVAVQVISGPEEARLAYVAAVSTLPLTGDALLVFDSGGGSSQFTWGTPARTQDQFSLDLGAVRVTERFGLADAVGGDTVEAARAAITADLSTLEGRPRPDMVIGIGGTATNLAAVAHALVRYDADVVHGTVVDLDEIDRQIEEYRRRSADERRGLAGLQPARAEVILAGACIVRTILEITGQRAVTVSDRGLRHGVVAERFGA